MRNLQKKICKILFQSVKFTGSDSVNKKLSWREEKTGYHVQIT